MLVVIVPGDDIIKGESLKTPVSWIGTIFYQKRQMIR